MMRIPQCVKTSIVTAWPWLKAVLTIAIASALLTAGFLPWTTEYVTQIPGSVLYEHQSAIQLAFAAFAGVWPATLIYFAVTGRRFVATTVIALIFMSATAVLAVLFRVAEERLGAATIMGIVVLPLLAAVATKAANIASQKKGDTSIGKKFKDSFNEALSNENMAELFLWTIAWASGGLGVFLLIKAIEIW